MNNKLLKTLMILSGVTLLTVTGCNSKKHESGDNPLYFEGTHDYSYTETTSYLVENGASNYCVVIPSGASTTIRSAKEEFVSLFKRATGFELPAIEETPGMVHSPDQRYISIGRTELLASTGIEAKRMELGNDGIRIVTKDNNIYIVGGADSGSLYGVYDFMQITFHYQQYAPDYFEMDTKVKNLNLYNYDVTDIPDIPHRAQNYGFFAKGSSDYDASNYGARMRMEKGRGYYFMPIYRDFDYNSPTVTSTNTNTYIPYDTYFNDHPNWFSNKCTSGKYQICYTAHGDKDEYDLLVEEVAKKIEFSLKRFDPVRYPEMNVVTFTMEDNFNTCLCDECLRQTEYYGAESGALNVFVNKVGEKVEAWMDEEENKEFAREGFRIIYFAYNAFENAPAYYDEVEGCYKPTKPEVVLRDNVGVYFAEINNLDYQQSLWAEDNESGKAMLDGWFALTDFMYYWTYQTNFSYYLYYYDTFAFYTQEMYNYVASKNVAMFFGQGQDSSGLTGTTWNNLKGYLDSRLMWDTTLDQEYLIQDYFRAMYGDAKDVMYNYFLMTRAHNAKLLEDHPQLQVLRSCYNDVRVPDYFPLGVLDSFVAQVDNSISIIQGVKDSDPIKYQALLNHIEAEAVTPLYTMLDLHSSELTIDKKREIIDRLYNDISMLSLEGKCVREHGSNLSSVIQGFEKTL